jgi:flagellar biogenesis protein FliO
MSLLTLIAIVVALIVAVLLALALAWLPMRLLLGRMARDISNFIQRQRDRRRVERGTPDRRHM